MPREPGVDDQDEEEFILTDRSLEKSERWRKRKAGGGILVEMRI